MKEDILTTYDIFQDWDLTAVQENQLLTMSLDIAYFENKPITRAKVLFQHLLGSIKTCSNDMHQFCDFDHDYYFGLTLEEYYQKYLINHYQKKRLNEFKYRFSISLAFFRGWKDHAFNKEELTQDYPHLNESQIDEKIDYNHRAYKELFELMEEVSQQLNKFIDDLNEYIREANEKMFLNSINAE